MTNDFTIENVWQQERPDIVEAVTKMWLSSFAFSDVDAARERATQLVYVVRNRDGDIIGASTGFKAYIKMIKNYCYAVRLMLDPAYRIPGLAQKLLVLTRDHFQSIAHEEKENPCVGVITLVENDQIRNGLTQAVWPASKMVYVGKTKRGYPIRLYYFPGARI